MAAGGISEGGVGRLYNRKRTFPYFCDGHRWHVSGSDDPRSEPYILKMVHSNRDVSLNRLKVIFLILARVRKPRHLLPHAYNERYYRQVL